MICLAKHTFWNPTQEEFNCPNCGGKCGSEFYIEELAEGSSDDCALLHEDDTLVCQKCGLSISGKKFARDEMKKRDIVICPCCNGKGFVSSEVAEDLENDM